MRRIALAALILASTFASSHASAGMVYIALGDSITFGETDLQYSPSFGNRGYVQNYAFTLGSRTGVTPGVINLAIDGETASSFMTGSGRVPPVNGRTDAILAAENLNYDPNALVSQGQKFVSTVAAQQAAGNTVGTVSITLGFNDLLTALTSNAGMLVPTILASYQAQYSAILAQIRQTAPGANLIVLGYYDPFPADPTSPAAPLFASYGTQLNNTIGSLAAQYGATFVNPAPAFVGHEAEYTYLAQQPAGATSPPVGSYVGPEPVGNVHPNALGYLAISNAIAATPSVVPEPASVMLLAVGCIGLAIASRGRPIAG